jgi:geranylgeranyl diphosphate synthase type 3
MRDSTKTFEYTRSVLETLESQALSEIERLGSNEKLEKVLLSLSLAKLKGKV